MKHIIKCMAKNCNIKIDIELKRTWYLDNNNKKIYTYGRENQLSFCLKHTEKFNNALNEMKQELSKQKIEKILKNNIKDNINNSLKDMLDKYKE